MANAIAGATANNCSFNCVSPKILITSKNWPQREKFLKYLRAQLKLAQIHYPYYPGAKDRFNSFREKYNQAEVCGEANGDCLPFLLIPNVDPNPGEKAFVDEAWAPVLCETALDATKDEFLDRAVQFANENVWGNLSCTLFINSSDESSHSDAYKRALKNLKYGTVSVNIWSALGYTMGSPWGAYPGNELRDIQSGLGFVHNPLMLDNVEKTVFKAPLPLTLETKLPWFASSKNSEHFWKTLSGYEFNTGLASVTSLLWNAFKN